MKEYITKYNGWSRNRKLNFYTYIFKYVANAKLTIKVRNRKNIDINDVYDWIVEVYSPDEEYSIEEAYKNLMEDDLYKQFYLDHDGAYINILPKEKLTKYINRGKEKFFKNYKICKILEISYKNFLAL